LFVETSSDSKLSSCSSFTLSSISDEDSILSSCSFSPSSLIFLVSISLFDSSEDSTIRFFTFPPGFLSFFFGDIESFKVGFLKKLL
jgi:hypothetical protein